MYLGAVHVSNFKFSAVLYRMSCALSITVAPRRDWKSLLLYGEYLTPSRSNTRDILADRDGNRSKFWQGLVVRARMQRCNRLLS